MRQGNRKCGNKACWNRVAVVGDGLYGLNAWPAALWIYIAIAAGYDTDNFSELPVWIIILAVTLGAAFTGALTYSNWVNNTVNDEERIKPIKVSTSLVPELESSSSGDEGDEDISFINKPSLAPLPWHEKYILSIGAHTTTVIDYTVGFASPFFVYGIVSQTNPLGVSSVGLGSAVLASVTSVSTIWSMRDALRRNDREKALIAKGSLLEQKKVTLPLIATIIGDSLGGIPAYCWTPGRILALILMAFFKEDLPVYFMDLPLPSVTAGSIIGSWLTVSIVYCQAIFYKVNQEDDSEATLPLTLFQKCLLPFIAGSYATDGISSVLFFTSYAVGGQIPTWLRGLVSALTPAAAAYASYYPTKAAANCFRIFNARKAGTSLQIQANEDQEPSSEALANVENPLPASYQLGQ